MTVSKSYIAFILNHRKLVGALMIAITIGSIGLIATKLSIRTNFFDLYPPRHEFIKTYTEFRKMFGSANLMTICLTAHDGDIITVNNISKIDSITRNVMMLSGANSYQVSSITHPSVKKMRVSSHGIALVPLIEKIPDNQEELDRVRGDIYLTEGIRGAYISPDNKSSLIYVGFWEETDMSTIYEQIDKMTKPYNDDTTSIFVAGYPMLYAWIYESAWKIAAILIVSGIILALLLFLHFWRLRGVMIPIVSSGLSALWAFGFAAAMGFNIDLLILVVPILLMGRTLSHSVQLLERYYEEIAKGSNKTQAIVTTYSSLFSPALFSIITDGVGVLTVAVSSIPLMQKLGYIGGFWVISMVLSVLTFQPLLQSILPAGRVSRGEVSRQKSAVFSTLNSIGGFSHFCCLGRRPFLFLFIPIGVIIIGGIYSINHLKVGDTSPGATIFFKDHPYNVSYDHINERFWGTNELIVIMAGEKSGALKDPEILGKMEEFRYYMSSDPDLGGSMTFLDFVHRLNRTFHEGIPKWETTPSDDRLLSTLLFLLESNATPGEMSRFFSQDYVNASLIFYYKEFSNEIVDKAIRMAKEFIGGIRDGEFSFRLAGGNIGIAAAVNSEVSWSYWVNLITIFVVIITICLLVYKSFRVALILIVPLAFAQVLCDLLMLLWGIDLNTNSLPVASIGVGVGIDYGIYMVDRIREEFRVHRDYNKAILQSLTTTGRAVMFTALTMIVSVIFWVFSGIKFHTEMGSLIALLMVLNMFGAMTIVPAGILILRPFGRVNHCLSGVETIQ